MSCGRHPSTPRAGWKRLGLLVGGFATVGLVAFHGILFWERVRDLSIFEPLVLLEWLLAAFLLVAMLHLRKRGIPLLHGRRALAFWLLVLFLHVMLAPPAVEWLEEHSGLLLVIPVSGLLAALAPRALRRLSRHASRPVTPGFWRRRHRPSRAPTDPGHPFQLFARPPPLFESSLLG
jgi:hypothetical protein